MQWSIKSTNFILQIKALRADTVAKPFRQYYRTSIPLVTKHIGQLNSHVDVLPETAQPEGKYVTGFAIRGLPRTSNMLTTTTHNV